MKTPQWWYKKNALGAPWWRPALLPLSWLWQAVNDAKRKTAKPYRSSLFVISVGNLTLGGSGKTPIAGEILRLLADQQVAGLSKGYGGSEEGPLWVDATRHTAAEVGDEPLMLAAHAPILIAKDRAAGLKRLEEDGAKVAVIDDAHQNLKIAKDLHILVVDGDTHNNSWPFGDGAICPMGPMREPLGKGLARADLCVLWLPDASTAPEPELLALLASKPVFIARLNAEVAVSGPVVAFAGIAKPWKFEATLRMAGLSIAAFHAYADHAEVPDSDLIAMLAEADRHAAQLVTTEKDWVRLAPLWRERVTALPISAQFDDVEGFAAALMVAISRHA